jgi:methionyl-tRNA formyltransferase
MSLRIVFMGTPEFAVAPLEALIAAGHEICAVYCQPAKPANRGHRLQPSPVEELARAHNIPVFTPKTLRAPDAQETFANLKADVGVVAAYGLILPKAILDAPTHGCLNIHGSILPRWRGAAPIHRALLAGDDHTGITIMQMDEGLDTGPMLLWETTPIHESATTPELHDTLAQMGARLLIKALTKLDAGTLTPTPQQEEGITYAHKLTRPEGELDWRCDAHLLARQIRAFTPWPGAFFFWNGEMIKVLEAKALVLNESHAPGTLASSKDFIVACGQNALHVTRLQRPGRAPLEAKAFLNGVDLGVGTMFALSDALCQKHTK